MNLPPLRQLKESRWWRIDAAGIGACAAVTLLAIFALFRPLQQGFDSFVLQQNELNEQRQQVVVTTTKLNSQRLQLNQLRQQIAKAPLRLEPAKRVNNRLAQLTALAGESGLRIEDVQPGKSVRGSRYEMVPIHVAGSGNYVTCLRFVNRMHAEFPDTGINVLDLTKTPTADAVAKFAFELQWYALLPE
ncbi:MAG TPA: type 4a pilus biogenesis protein PilO [Tepidisphaeraceae bacterium]|jgi:Tfp pilus assembly protein PilO